MLLTYFTQQVSDSFRISILDIFLEIEQIVPNLKIVKDTKNNILYKIKKQKFYGFQQQINPFY